MAPTPTPGAKPSQRLLVAPSEPGATVQARGIPTIAKPCPSERKSPDLPSCGSWVAPSQETRGREAISADSITRTHGDGQSGLGADAPGLSRGPALSSEGDPGRKCKSQKDPRTPRMSQAWLPGTLVPLLTYTFSETFASMSQTTFHLHPAPSPPHLPHRGWWITQSFHLGAGHVGAHPHGWPLQPCWSQQELGCGSL